MKISFILNNKAVTVTTDPMKRLLDVLREDFGFTGTKEGCGEGECGACTILLEGRSVLSCLIAVGSVEGKNIETIESLSEKNNPHYNIIEAFRKEGACQCGFCIPGFVVSTADYHNNKGKAIFTDEKDVNSDDYIKRSLSGNLCRCTGYETIMRAVNKSNKEGN
jgi:aerobic-type carbon monoxide dehydrogenase small subunit (CoxS/CutS family)